MAARAEKTTPVRRKARAAARPQPILQWIMAGVGGAVTLAVIWVIGSEAMRPERPADLSAHLVGVHAAGKGWIAEIEVRNAGLDTAAAVEIEGRQAGQTAAATLDHVPGEGSATAYLPFAQDARRPPPVIVIKGWSEP